jgi:hypothetical protein
MNETDLARAVAADLGDDVLAAVEERPDALAVPDWHRAELDARRAAHRDDPDAARDWSAIREELRHDCG